MRTRKNSKVLLLLIVSVICFHSPVLLAQTVKDTTTMPVKHVVIVKDNPITAMLDSLALLNCFEKFHKSADNAKLNIYKYAPNYVPTFSDSVYTLRIAKLNAKTPFGLVYNEDVLAFINLYAVKKRQLTSRILGLSEYYFPLFETYLTKYNIPLELKYLAVVESALNPVAKSFAGANGLWQFIYTTGKMYDLNVTSYVDERFDPVKSTIAACQYFRDLYAIYKDWSLVLAAYNSGPGNVNRAIRLSKGEMNFWKIKKFLPKETQSYVPAFIAVVYVMNYAPEHNLYPIAPDFMLYETDTVTVKQKLTFDQISEALKIPLKDIEYLNPCYKGDVIPAFKDDVYSLRLPKKYIGDFMANDSTIYFYKTKAMIEEEKLLAEKKKKDSLLAVQQAAYKKVTPVNTTTTNPAATEVGVYIVKAGDGLGTIAAKYKCTQEQIETWNKMKNANIFPGQKLYVQDPATISTTKVDTNKTKTEAKTDNSTHATTPKTTEATTVKYVYHTVQKGDSLWGIANQYKGATIEEIKKLNNLNDNSTLYVGQKLKIAVGS